MKAEELARCLWAIGDETRLRILEHLPSAPDCASRKTVCEIAGILGLTQPTISNHLARLRTLDIVRHKKHCREVYYCVNPERVREIQEALAKALKSNSEESTQTE